MAVSATPLMDRLHERNELDQLVTAVRAGESRVLVISGEPGVGKTALLDYAAGQAENCRIMRLVGMQSEMELPLAGLHHLYAPLLDGLDSLPEPQQEALRIAFGMSAGPTPDRFMLYLAALGLLSAAAEDRPIVCLVDDQQWLDRASAEALGFIARRLRAEPVGLLFASRVPGDELAGLPELTVTGLRDADARALLDSALAWPVDVQVRDRIVAEARGNPLALLELPRGLTRAQLAGGFGLPDTWTASGTPTSRIEESFQRQLAALPAETQKLLLIAAADPSGNPVLLWRAAARFGLTIAAAAPAADAGLAEFGSRVRFRHPIARAAAYQSAPAEDRRRVHAALADASDPVTDPDRRAWHRAQAAPGPDEDVAAELVRSAGRAQARGGLAAAAAFFERAALLTPDPVRHAARVLAAARAKRDAGELDAAETLLATAEAGELDARQRAELTHLRGTIALDRRRAGDAASELLHAARQLKEVDGPLARTTYLEAFWAAIWAGTPAVLREAAQTARAGSGGQRLVDMLLDALAVRCTDGFTAAAPALALARERVLAAPDGVPEAERWNWHPAALVALELWDFDAWRAVAANQVDRARATGALVNLQFSLTYVARTRLLTGELAAAARLIDEDRLISEATGNPTFEYTALMLAAWRGDEARVERLAEATAWQGSCGLGVPATIVACARAVLSNGLGRYDAARAAVRPTFLALRSDPAAYVPYSPLIVPELAEAAYRTGDADLVGEILEWLGERTRVTPTDWVLGIEARVRAFLSKEAEADRFYRESAERLRGARLSAELARTQLLHGEWLRRQQRRTEARDHLRSVHEALVEMGMLGFAERARRELAAAGEIVRQRTVRNADGTPGTGNALTAQEDQVSRLAREGLSNPEIAARLFISTRTVQYHLTKVFTKLGISSRGQLHRVL